MSLSMISLDHLTEEEKDQIEAVLNRDEEERIKEEHRIKDMNRKFKAELHALRKKAAHKANGENQGDRICMRCQEPLGLIFNSGDLCPKCQSKVCNDCQVQSPTGKTWLCTVCNKQVQLKLGNSHWVPPKSGEVSDYPSLHGSQLLRVSLNNSRANSTVDTSDYRPSYEDFSDEASLSDEGTETGGDSKPNSVMADIHEEPESVSQASDVTETADDDFPMEDEDEEYGEEALHGHNTNGYATQHGHQVVIDTTPRLRGDEWEQMLNGKLRDADNDSPDGPSAYALATSNGSNGHHHYNSNDRRKHHGNGTKRHSAGHEAEVDHAALANIGTEDFRKASRTSLVSLYSQADESYRVPVTGDVNFGLHYNYKTNTFEVKVLSCRDLHPVDAKKKKVPTATLR